MKTNALRERQIQRFYTALNDNNNQIDENFKYKFEKEIEYFNTRITLKKLGRFCIGVLMLGSVGIVFYLAYLGVYSLIAGGI